MVKLRCVMYKWEHVVGEGRLFGFCLYCDSKIFSAANLAHHVCSPFLALESTAGLFVNSLFAIDEGRHGSGVAQGEDLAFPQ